MCSLTLIETKTGGTTWMKTIKIKSKSTRKRTSTLLLARALSTPNRCK